MGDAMSVLSMLHVCCCRTDQPPPHAKTEAAAEEDTPHLAAMQYEKDLHPLL
jgi:hypothetical protein